MAVAVTPYDTPRPDADIDLPPTWLAAVKVGVMVALLVAAVLVLAALGILGIAELFG